MTTGDTEVAVAGTLIADISGAGSKWAVNGAFSPYGVFQLEFNVNLPTTKHTRFTNAKDINLME